MTDKQPIGWIYEDDEGRITFSQMAPTGMFWEPVYRAAPKREWQGLTYEQIETTALRGVYKEALIAFAHAIEAKLREKNA